MRTMISNRFIILAGTLMFALGVSSAVAENYVSFKGGFYITYPEDWIKVDYNTADMFLQRANVDRSALAYEAVFAPAASSPFFASDYLILTLDSMEWLYDYQIDSIVEEMNRNFGVGVKYFPVWDFLADVKSNQPVYDKENKILSVVNDIVQGDVIIKKNLLIKKFYDKGVANFFFYAPDSLFDDSRQVFQSIVMSFSTENIEDALPKENVKVAEKKPASKSNSGKNMIPIYVAILIAIIILARRRRAAKQKREGT